MQSAMGKLRQRPAVPIAATDQDNIQSAETIPNSLAAATLVQFVTEGPRLRLVALDGVDASVAAMENGIYALKVRLRAVTRNAPSLAARKLISFLGSPEADKIIRESGGVAVARQDAMTSALLQNRKGRVN